MEVTLEASAAATAAKANGATGWFLRLWDAFPSDAGLATVSTAGHPDLSQVIDLGDGLKVRLGGGASAAVFRRGDYWTFAARRTEPLTGRQGTHTSHRTAPASATPRWPH